MDDLDMAAQSQRTLDMLEAWSQQEEIALAKLATSMLPPPPRVPKFSLPPPLPPKRRQTSLPPPLPRPIKTGPQTSREVRYKLADSWVLLTEAQEAIQDWQRRAKVEVGLQALNVRVRTALMMVDSVIAELEPITRKRNK